MPTIDAARGLLVIRIVYDGPALSGKTTSVKALADGVGRELQCPEERDGRTVYFDWVEYVGGLFEGRQISCQIVSVPGQHELAARRQLLLESADAVVCVLDTREPELQHGLDWLRGLVPHCRAESPPVGIVVQANKRDAADAVQREELRRSIAEIAPIAIVESIAPASDGIREAFVLAVRLALDRVRALSGEGRLTQSDPAERSAQDLMRTIREAETKRRPAAPLMAESATHLRELLPRSSGAPPAPAAPSSDADESPFIPDPMMPGGMIWPPVDGRTLLYEVSGLAVQPARTARGDWWGSGAGWRFHSSPHALYADADAARNELISWARLHAGNANKISQGRVVILADAGAGRMRLWQLVRVEPALRERLEAALAVAEPAQAADEVLDVAAQLIDAHEWFRHGSLPLPCTLWTVAAARSQRPCFVGLMPDSSSQAHSELSAESLLRRELAPQLRQLRRTRVDYGQVRSALLERAETGRSAIAQAVTELVRAID